MAATSLSTSIFAGAWPWLFRTLVAMPNTTASIGMRASRLEKASAEARTGQRLREKLLQTSSQKCAVRNSQ